jgi:predicted dinucleotide-binding enzyme
MLFTRRTLLAASAMVLAASPRALAQAKRPIGIIGAGNIGGAVGALWVKSGHPVMFSSRNPDELKDMVAELGPLAHAGTVAVPYAALPQIGSDYRAALKGKVILDACNAVPTRDGDAITKEADENGTGVTSQKYLAGTRLVRAFNTLGFNVFKTQSNRPDPKLAIPIAGDDADAVRVAQELVRDAGFEPLLVGGLESAKKFQQRGGPGYGVAGSAAELKQKIGM